MFCLSHDISLTHLWSVINGITALSTDRSRRIRHPYATDCDCKHSPKQQRVLKNLLSLSDSTQTRRYSTHQYRSHIIGTLSAHTTALISYRECVYLNTQRSVSAAHVVPDHAIEVPKCASDAWIHDVRGMSPLSTYCIRLCKPEHLSHTQHTSYIYVSGIILAILFFTIATHIYTIIFYMLILLHIAYTLCWKSCHTKIYIVTWVFGTPYFFVSCD